MGEEINTIRADGVRILPKKGAGQKQRGAPQRAPRETRTQVNVDILGFGEERAPMPG